MPPIRRILVLAVDGAQSLDVLGPVEVFEYAERQVPGAYRIDVVGPGADGWITMGNGLRLGVEPLPGPAAAARHARRRRRRGRAPRDRGPGDRRLDRARVASRAAHDVDLHRLLPARRGGPAGRPARDDALGVLRRPWPSATPRCELDPDPVFVRDGDVWTSAGVTAGMDLALALVEDDLGAEVALAVARLLVVFLKRPGGQSQFSGALSVQQASRPALRELQAWIAGHLDEDLSVAALADRAHLSERSFARAFRAEVGQTPGGLRRDAARRARPRAAGGRRRVAGGGRPGRRLLQRRGPAPRVPPARRRRAPPPTASASGSPPERFELAYLPPRGMQYLALRRYPLPV